MDRERIESTVERLIGHTHRLLADGKISSLTHATIISEIQTWATGKRRCVVAVPGGIRAGKRWIRAELQVAYQADWREDQDGTYR